MCSLKEKKNIFTARCMKNNHKSLSTDVLKTGRFKRAHSTIINLQFFMYNLNRPFFLCLLNVQWKGGMKKLCLRDFEEEKNCEAHKSEFIVTREIRRNLRSVTGEIERFVWRAFDFSPSPSTRGGDADRAWGRYETRNSRGWAIIDIKRL